MKTAVSIPDELFQTAEKIAKRLGIPRSQLFARALEEFVQVHNKDNVTDKLNEIYSSEENNKEFIIKSHSVEVLRRSLKNDTW